jgi:hypothetical protein
MGSKVNDCTASWRSDQGQFCHTNSLIWIKKLWIPHESLQCCYSVILEKPTFGVTFERSRVLALPKSQIVYVVSSLIGDTEYSPI